MSVQRIHHVFVTDMKKEDAHFFQKREWTTKSLSSFYLSRITERSLQRGYVTKLGVERARVFFSPRRARTFKDKLRSKLSLV